MSILSGPERGDSNQDMWELPVGLALGAGSQHRAECRTEGGELSCDRLGSHPTGAPLQLALVGATGTMGRGSLRGAVRSGANQNRVRIKAVERKDW